MTNVVHAQSLVCTAKKICWYRVLGSVVIQLYTGEDMASVHHV